MKTVFVGLDMFAKIIDIIDAQPTKKENGETHGKYQWTRHHGTRWVAESSFVLKDGEFEWLFCIANYLYEAYKDK